MFGGKSGVLEHKSGNIWILKRVKIEEKLLWMACGATNFKFGLIISKGPSKQKPIKNFGEKGACVYPGTVQIFGVPLLSQEQV